MSTFFGSCCKKLNAKHEQKENDRKPTGKQGNKEKQGKTKDNFCKSIKRWGTCWKTNEKLRKTNGAQQKDEKNEGKPMRKQWKPMENKENVRKMQENQEETRKSKENEGKAMKN